MELLFAILNALGTAVLGAVLAASVATIAIFVAIGAADVADVRNTNNKEYPS